MQDVFAASLDPQRTVELEKMFQRCGYSGADWIDMPGFINFSQQVPLANGGLVAGQKQAIGNLQGADFYLRRISTIGFFGTNGPQIFAQIKLPSGRYLQTGNSGNVSNSVGIEGTLAPGPLGLVKPEIHCPAGSSFTIDMQNVSATWNPPGATIVASIIFIGVYRYRLTKAC